MSVGELWPERGVQTAEWNRMHRQNSPPGNSGNSVTVDHGEPYWQVDIAIDALPNSELARKWDAFITRREGAKNSFTMSRAFQCIPRSNVAQSDAAISVARTDRAASTITLAGVEAGYVASEGDMIGFFTARSGFYIGQVLRDTVFVPGDPNEITIPVWPAPFDPHPTEAKPRRIKALGEFVITTQPGLRQGFTGSGLRFTARQVIRG